jgi:hypothetical protein
MTAAIKKNCHLLGFSIEQSFQYKLNPEEYPDFFDSVQSRLHNKGQLLKKFVIEIIGSVGMLPKT